MAFDVTKLGLLAEATTTTIGTTTVYTVPASSTAKIQLLWAIENNASSATDFSMLLNDQGIYGAALAINEDCWTGTLLATDKHDSSTIYAHGPVVGKLDVSAPYQGEALLMALPQYYYLDASDTVKYSLSAGVGDAYVAVYGTLYSV